MVPRQSTGPILAPPSYIYIIHSSANTACNVYTSVHCVHQCSHQTYKVHRNQVQFGDITAAQATGHGQVIYIWVGITMWSTSTSTSAIYLSGPVLPALKLPPVSHLCLHPTCNEHSHQEKAKSNQQDFNAQHMNWIISLKGLWP